MCCYEAVLFYVFMKLCCYEAMCCFDVLCVMCFYLSYVLSCVIMKLWVVMLFSFKLSVCYEAVLFCVFYEAMCCYEAICCFDVLCVFI